MLAPECAIMAKIVAINPYVNYHTTTELAQALALAVLVTSYR